MKKLSVRARSVVRLAFAVAVLLFYLLPASVIAQEPLAPRLLRTVQIGVPQNITIEQIHKIAESQATDYTTEMLARSALLVLGQNEPKLISFDELLDDLLNHIVSDGTPFKQVDGLPRFRAKETVFTMIYAMVMSGNQERAVDILEKNSLSGSRYKQAVVLSALRNIGTPRALSVIQQYAEKGQDRNLAEATLADEDYPVLSEMHDRWGLVPPAQRTRDNLRSIIQLGCDQRSALAAYWLGYFAPSPDPKRDAAELDALKSIIHTNNPTCEMMEHVIALKSLALRSAETVEYWQRLALHTPNAWERHQIVINAFGRWGEKFAPAALELLKTDTAQYVQWELLDGNLETRQGREYRSYWDIWIPANVLLVLQFDDSQWRPAMEQKELNALLDWLDSGARPRDVVVLNHMVYHLLEFTSGDDTRRLLRVFNALPQRNDNWWILQLLRDPAGLPLLRFWSTLPAPKDQQQMLANTVKNLEYLATKKTAPPNSCCEATEACLLQQVKRSTSSAASSDFEIHSEEDARIWLNTGAAATIEYKVRYTDELKRSAIVRRSDGREEIWQYLYDCWHNVDKPHQEVATH